jgi:tetratricopeptide (TPR) repeat protein
MILKPVKNISILALFLFILFSICVFSQTQRDYARLKADSLQEYYLKLKADSLQQIAAALKADSLLEIDAFKKADILQDKQQKEKAFRNIISAYPNNRYKSIVLLELFSLYLDDNKVEAALKYADQAVHSVPEELKVKIYDEVAYSLARKKVGLDTAAVYAQRAVSVSNAVYTNYRNIGLSVKYAGLSLNTQALVMHVLGKADSAFALENEAAGIEKNNPALLSTLAAYQEAAGYRFEALYTAAEAILFGNTGEALTNFNEWIRKVKPGIKEQDKLRKDIVDSTLKLFFNRPGRENKLRDNSTAGAFLSLLRTDLNQADTWVKEAVNSLNDSSKITDRVLFTKNYGLTLFAQGKYKEALEILNSVEDLADPLNVNFWYTLGKSYEKVKEYQKALDSYINGLVDFRMISLQIALRELGAKEGINEIKIESLIAKKRNKSSSFEPGRYKGNKPEDNVMLAELFTGADAEKCASADYAFDYLSEYFTRSEVAILEYHLHIPDPDPMANLETYSRYKYYDYGGFKDQHYDFGGHMELPVVFIQGTARIDGGGKKVFTKNKFDEYKYTLEKFLTKNSNVKLSGSVKQTNDSISVDLQINKESVIPDSASLHLALVEKSIQYPANSGVTKHIFVVRSLFNGPNGTPIKLGKGNESVSAAFNIIEFEEKLSKYLDNPTNDPTWVAVVSVPWKQRLDELDRGNLAVVAWVQINKTKEVLQTKYFDVPANNLK